MLYFKICEMRLYGQLVILAKRVFNILDGGNQ